MNQNSSPRTRNSRKSRDLQGGHGAQASPPTNSMRSRKPGAQRRAGRDLDQLLMAALYRAVTLPQVTDVARAIAHHLHLHVACSGKQRFST